MDGVVWWTDLCGNDTQYNAFWSPPLTLNTSQPILTQCLQRTVLTWVPCGVLLLASPFYSLYLSTRGRHRRFFSFSLLNFIQTMSCLGLLICSVLGLIWTLDNPSSYIIHPVDIQYWAVRTFTMLVTTLLVRWMYLAGVHTSATLFIFWVLFFVSETVTLHSTVIQSDKGFQITDHRQQKLVYASYAFVIASLIGTFFADVPKDENVRNNNDEKRPLLGKMNGNAQVQKQEKPMPDLTSPAWKTFTYLWITKDIIRAYRRPVTMKDLYDLRPDYACKTLLRIFSKYYRYYKEEGVKKSSLQGSFAWAIICAVAYKLIFGILVRLVSIGFTFLQPQILSAFVAFIDSDDPYTWKGVFLSFSFCVCSVIASVLLHWFLINAYNAGMQSRSIINAIIYRKALKLSGSAKKTTTVGEIVNLMSVDAQKVQDAFTFSNLLWETPIEIAIAMYFLWQVVGVASMAGLAAIIILIPINGVYLANKVRQYQGKQMVDKDQRVKLMTEILSGIKILKLYAWEPSFEKTVSKYRNLELTSLWKALLTNAITSIFWALSPYLISLSIFAAYVLISPDNVLDPQKAFVTMSLINTFNFTIYILPLGVSFFGQAVVSFNRINKFLKLDELTEGTVEKDKFMSDAIKIENGNFSWGTKSSPVLKNLNLSIPKGQLVAVVGSVGAGKSSLTATILGETVKQSGRVTINGSIAYIPQQAWIQNATVRDNIIFQRPFSESQYNKTLEVCALVPDLKILEGGDLTEIGEKGINLSGGQKQRVSLARAVYQDEDIYLLDDPLSAVDSHVGKHIFNKVIGPEGVLKNKTRILVTHGVTYLPKVDLIIVLNDGQVSEIGHFQELVNKNGAFAEFLKNHFLEETTSSNDDDDEDEGLKEVKRQISVLSGTESDQEVELSPKIRKKSRKRSRLSTTGEAESRAAELDSKNASKLIEEETSQEGNVKLSVIWTYVTSAGVKLFYICMICQAAFVAAQVLTNIWLSEWSTDPIINGTVERSLVNLRLGVYGGLIGLQGIIILGVSLSMAFGCVNASRNIHQRLLNRILHAPMAFFDTTPLGRIMNRFSKDMDILDTNMPLFARGWLMAIVPVLSTIIVICYTTPMFLIVVVPVGILYVLYMRLSITYLRQMKRIDAVLRSPIYAHFDESIVGAGSIRAYGRQEAFIHRCDILVDQSTQPYYLISTTQRWMGVIMESIGSLIVFFAALFAVLSRGSIDAGMAGLSVTYALQVTAFMNSAVRCSTEMETYMVSVERINEYSNIKTEAEWRNPDANLSPGWPSQGSVTFNGYCTRYRPGLDLVLKNVSCNINPGEQIGIVGRTGAGKSSFSLALFRLIESAGGNICIDGRDISSIGLHDLRSKLTIIPQDPVVFCGSLRMNLDPLNQHTDAEIWEALQLAHLKDFAKSLKEGLQYDCGEGGESLSVGQRQLVCLARALLRNSKILVLDEATAAVDLETDALIQNTIRTQFQNRTVLAVAHRLNTVMDYDRIMVLDKGEIKEFDTPKNLLAEKTSVFYGMARDAGLA